MFRPDNTDPSPIADIVAAGQQDWDGKVKAAMASNTA
jgi:hypothetical protein